jgi:hypothetical protein
MNYPMIDPQITLTLHGRLNPDTATLALFYDAMLRFRPGHLVTTEWTTSAAQIAIDGAEVLFETNAADVSRALLHLDGCLVLLELYAGQVEVRIAREGRAVPASVLERVREHFPEIVEDRSVPLTFWALKSDGSPQQITRRIAVPSWVEIAQNYTRRTQDALHRLFARSHPGGGGQLILWTGDPGTGKTTALRALAREWRAWCRFLYVTDPERFFGGESAYMLRVLLAEDGSDKAAGQPDRWRVLIFEDTGELLSADAKERMGQGLSRLLNVVDGLIGQGLNVLILVTTNEPLGHLHPAVSRPGRCAFQHEFRRLSAEEANVWLRRRGAPATVEAPHTIAELYGIAQGNAGESKPSRVGFAGSAHARTAEGA